MEEEKKPIEVNPYALLAAHLKLTVFSEHPLLFIDPNGKKWVKTEHGFASSYQVNYRDELLRNKEKVEFLKKEIREKDKKISSLEKEVKRTAIKLLNANEDHKILHDKYFQAKVVLSGIREIAQKDFTSKRKKIDIITMHLEKCPV